MTKWFVEKSEGMYDFMFTRSSISTAEAYKWWVFTAVSTIAWGVASLQKQIVSENEKQIKHEYEKLITYSLLEAITSHLKIFGACYIYKVMSWRSILKLHILQPNLVSQKVDNFWQVIGYVYSIQGREITFEKEEIIPILNFSPFDSWWFKKKWYSDMQAAAIAIYTDDSASKWNWRFFKNSARPDFILETEKEIKPETVKQMYEDWARKYAWTDNAHKTAILHSWLKARELSPSQKEMDFVESRKFSRDEILWIFKVPKAILGLWEGAGGSMNIRSYQEIFARNAILPVTMAIQDAFNEYMFKWIWMFEFIWVIPADEKQVLSDWTNWIVTLNEARTARWYKPREWGDKTYHELMWLTVTDTTETKPTEQKDPQKDDSKKSLDSLAWYMAKAMTKWTDESNDLRVKVRDKRLKKYDILIQKAVNEVFEKQMDDVIEWVKETKWLQLELPDFSQYKLLWQIKLAWIFKKIINEEGQIAIEEVKVDSVFKTWAPEVVKLVQSTLWNLQKSADKTTVDRLKKIFSSAIDEGIWAQETKNRIRDEFKNFSERRSEAIARTETVRLSNDASVIAWEQSGVVEAKKWWTALDDRVAPFDKSLHGKVIKLKENFFKKWDVLEVDGQKMKMDYSDISSPPLHPNCRCTLIPILKE